MLRNNKRKRIESDPIPGCIARFYEAINATTYDHDKIMFLIKENEFISQFQGEINFSAEQFEPFHDHCFENPLLAICHIASQHLLEISDNELLEIIQHFIKIGANVHARDEEGKTPLLLLASSYPNRHHLVKCIHYLKEQGADINTKDYEGKTALHHAYVLLNFELATILSKEGAIVAIDKEKNTFLMECEEHGLDDLNNVSPALIDDLKRYRIVSDIPEEKDDSFFQSIKNYKLSTTLDDIKLTMKKNPVITPRTILFALTCIYGDELATALFSHLNKRLKSEWVLSRQLEKQPAIEQLINNNTSHTTLSKMSIKNLLS